MMIIDRFRYYQTNKNHGFVEAFSRVRARQEMLRLSYYDDIAKHSGKVNAMHIDPVLRSVPAQMQKAQDISEARFKFNDVVPGVSHYARLVGVAVFAKKYHSPYRVILSGKPLRIDDAEHLHQYPLYLAGRFPL